MPDKKAAPKRHAAYKAAWGRSPKGKFADQRKQSRVRGIEWRLTFEQWLCIWGDKLPLRGRTHGKLVMARNGDAGPYALGNVSIITTEENLAQRKAASGSSHGMAILDEAKVENIRSMLSAGLTQVSIATKYDVARSTITAIARGVNWASA